jgi:hypothetical protein
MGKLDGDEDGVEVDEPVSDADAVIVGVEDGELDVVDVRVDDDVGV